MARVDVKDYLCAIKDGVTPWYYLILQLFSRVKRLLEKTQMTVLRPITHLIDEVGKVVSHRGQVICRPTRTKMVEALLDVEAFRAEQVKDLAVLADALETTKTCT